MLARLRASALQSWVLCYSDSKGHFFPHALRARLHQDEHRALDEQLWKPPLPLPLALISQMVWG